MTKEAASPAMLEPELQVTLNRVASFYDARKVGDVGNLGFRRSTHLGALLSSLDVLFREQALVPGRTRFLDLGCADGRVNVLLSYLVETSVGVEIDEWILEDYEPLRTSLLDQLAKEGLPLPPDNIHLFLGDSTDGGVHENIRRSTDLPFHRFDLFYTYLTMYQEFAQLVAEQARRGSHFLIYGLDIILPELPGLNLVRDPCLTESKLALYRKL
jgi:hypothetical protein